MIIIIIIMIIKTIITVQSNSTKVPVQAYNSTTVLQ